MGADWYTCLTYFGYSIKVPDDINFRKLVNIVNEINEFLQEPYKITGLLENFHSRLENASDLDLEILDSYSTILIGFKPNDNIDMFIQNVNELKEYVTDNHYLMGLELDETPKFYSGIEWFTNMYDGYESSESDDDYEDYEGNDNDHDDDDEEDDEEDDDTSDEDETKISPETENK